MNTKSKFQWSEILLAICICFGFVIMVASCSKDQAEPKKEEPKVEKLTYANFAGVFFQSKCSGCHGASGIEAARAKWIFSDYNSVKSNISRINEQVLVLGAMPRGGSLTATEKENLKKWIEAGTPEK